MIWEQAGIALFAFAIVCEQAHVASPILLAWSHSGLRQIALSRPIETMLLPMIAIVGALLAPFMVIWWVYWAWNAYHFGAQHYGMARIFGWQIDRELAVAATMVLMLWVPFVVPLPWWWMWAMMVAIDFNHWLVDIGLSSRVSRCWWLFVAAVAVLGCVGFLWKMPRADHIATLAVPWVIKARWGVGIAHFLYSRWVWKLSDEKIRAAIGNDLFGHRNVSYPKTT